MAALPPSTDPAAPDLGALGLVHSGRVHANLPPARLTEMALARGEGLLTDGGAVATYTGERTGRSPRDRYLVDDGAVHDEIDWGVVNRPISPEHFERLFDRVRTYLQDKELFTFDGWACADPRYRLPVRVISELAWHTLFARCLLIRPPAEALPNFRAGLTILSVPGLKADPARDGTRSDVFVVLALTRGIVLVGGTEYAGEIKKAVFSILNYLLPKRGVFPMHCAANVGATGDTALFFGLSGTGKTTLSADPQRRLIGDDEHGWSDQGVFNLEGGCYAKTIHLSEEGEPQIWNAIRFGCVLENVVVDPVTRRPDYDDDRYTENTRAAYPIDFIDRCVTSGQGGHPSNLLLLTCDAFGVLPPLSRLTPAQALYHFLSGYTAKVAGTEAGVTAPEATFSTCFAAPFLPLPPARYADQLLERLTRHQASVWLVNTGWTGGPQGLGRRLPLEYTRSMVQAILGGALEGVRYAPDPVFGLPIPASCPGVPPDLLQPRQTWTDTAAYDARARQLADRFRANFASFAPTVSEAVRQAGPPS